jgi:metal-responsive CopG/Arc/MetJ family transcriptional regulator
MGRPPIGPVIEVRFPSHLVTALDVIAERDGVSRAAVIRSACERYAEDQSVALPANTKVGFHRAIT